MYFYWRRRVTVTLFGYSLGVLKTFMVKVVVTLYHFHIIDADGGRREAQSLRLPNIDAVWAQIAALAGARDAEGRHIRVTNEAGGIVVLVGASTARRLQSLRAA